MGALSAVAIALALVGDLLLIPPLLARIPRSLMKKVGLFRRKGR
jgi:hypothetical protein